MSVQVDELIAPLLLESAGSHTTIPVGWRDLQNLSPNDIAELVRSLADNIDRLSASLNDRQWQLIFAALLHRCDQLRGAEDQADIAQQLARLYTQGSSLDAPRYQILTCLTALLSETALGHFVELLRDDPPQTDQGVTTPFMPLMREGLAAASNALFPSLFDCLQHPQVAPSVVDLANFVARQDPHAPHPAASRRKGLTQLLAGVTRRLELVQQPPQSTDDAPLAATPESISHAIALAVSLCDALALLGDDEAKPTLAHAMKLRHRRVQLEAASALARLGDEEGKSALLEMAAEPSLRLRVLHYADELGIENEIDEQFSTGAAVGEAELVTFLATPEQYGVPPTRCELIDTRTLYWPGYEEPRDCYLFRFAYEAVNADGTVAGFENVGIAGPLTLSIRADISQLSHDDVFALFAGWHAEHERISHRPVDRDATLTEVEQQLLAALHEGPYEHVEPQLIGTFFDDRVLVARANKAEAQGLAVSAADGVTWFAETSELRPMSAEDAYSIYKGRKLLGSFN